MQAMGIFLVNESIKLQNVANQSQEMLVFDW